MTTPGTEQLEFARPGGLTLKISRDQLRAGGSVVVAMLLTQAGQLIVHAWSDRYYAYDDKTLVVGTATFELSEDEHRQVCALVGPGNVYTDDAEGST